MYISVVTHRSRQRFVTKSIRSSVELKVRGLERSRAKPFIFGNPVGRTSLCLCSLTLSVPKASD